MARSVDVHQFSMIPRADIPRSKFRVEKMYKTTLDSGWLVPVYVDEVLPGDTFNLRMSAFGRLATPIVPVMDNLRIDSFFFFVPNRLTWNNWHRFMGEQSDPNASIDFVVPKVVSPVGGFAIGTLGDYFGLPTVGQVAAGETVEVSAFHFRAYNLIWNEWFRDENIQTSVIVERGEGPDTVANYNLLRRGKRHDYFTSALPSPQKGPSVPLAIGGIAPVHADTTSGGPTFQTPSSVGSFSLFAGTNQGSFSPVIHPANLASAEGMGWSNPGLYADLGAATAATINQLRQSFQIQRLLERDARGGTRYTEIVFQHFGVRSPDARLNRPEYLGGGSSAIIINPIAQTSATSEAGSGTPQGNLAAMGTTLSSGHGFTQSFTEHGVILGMVCIRADLTYQQGLRRMWSRSTRYDFYFPAFSHLGEQAILNKEIYCTGIDAQDNAAFGYQERWAEMRHNPSEITGLFRSTAAGTLDIWHLAQRFTSLPTLSNTFIQEMPPLERVLAVGPGANGQQLLLDCFFGINMARPMPLHSTPGLIDHF